MAKKKKKKQRGKDSAASTPAPTPDATLGDAAHDRLRAIRDDLARKEAARLEAEKRQQQQKLHQQLQQQQVQTPQRAQRDRAPGARAHPAHAEPDAAPRVPRSPDELFEMAIAQLDEVDPYDMKFGAGLTSKLPPHVEEATLEDDVAPEPGSEQPDELDPSVRVAVTVFEQEMAALGIKRIASRRIEHTPHRPPRLAPDFEPDRPSLSTESIPGPRDLYDEVTGKGSITLDGQQRRLLQRARRAERPLPEISLRRATRDQALEQLHDFLVRSQRAGEPLVRVIAGKGKRSRDEPVLKRVVEIYLEQGQGAPIVSAHAPEPNRDGDFGAFIFQLRLPGDER